MPFGATAEKNTTCILYYRTCTHAYMCGISPMLLYIEVTITGLQKSFADFQGLIASLWMNRDWIDFSLGRIHFPHKIQSNMPCFNAGPNIIYNYIYYKYINNITVLRGRKLHIKILIQLPQTDGCGVMLLFQRYLQYTTDHSIRRCGQGGFMGNHMLIQTLGTCLKMGAPNSVLYTNYFRILLTSFNKQSRVSKTHEKCKDEALNSG